MPRYETRTSQFGLVSGIHQPLSDLILISEPTTLFAPEARKGHLYILAEADHDVAHGRDACQLVARTIRKQFYENGSYSITSALRKAITTANTVLYQQNFGMVAQKRVMVGLTCAVIKDSDLYVAQIAPSQAYILTERRLRALPTHLSWNGVQAGVTPLIKASALGTSLSIEPEFYRAVLRPGDAVLLCSSNLSRILSRDEVFRLLQSPDPKHCIEGLAGVCSQNGIPEAHALAVAVQDFLSPAAQAAPLSRTGVTERGLVVLRTVGDWVAQFTSEVTLLVRGARDHEQHRAQTRRAQERFSQDQLTQPHHEPPYTMPVAPSPRPLDIGPPLEEQVDLARQQRRGRVGTLPERPPTHAPPPSLFLGEQGATRPAHEERRIDLSDTPGMAALGRHTRMTRVPAAVPESTRGEYAVQWLDRGTAAMTGMIRKWRRRRPPPSAMPQIRRRQGLSYRRQSPPFPILLLLLLVSLVALLIVYGVNLSHENALRQADDAISRAEQTIASLREAPDDATAQERLDTAALVLAEIRSSTIITATQENRLRYEKLQREYERALGAIQKLTYFSDLTVLATHPLANGRLDTVVVPPPPPGITVTESFNAIYALDTTAGTLYRAPKSGGRFASFLSPDDTFGPLKVGAIKAQTWRVDNIVTVAQSTPGGPFTFYFRSDGTWRFSNLAGSEEWGDVSKHFQAVNYEGNLYIWGALPGQILKYFSGRYGDFPIPWIQNDGGHVLDSALSLAIDGQIYLLQPDGHILVFGAGAFVREITPRTITPPLVTPTGFFVTGTPDSGAIFLVDLNNERILQIDKQTGALIQQIRARPDGPIHLDQLTSVFVDDSAGRVILYIVNGNQIFRGSLPTPPQPFHEAGSSGSSGTSVPITPAPTSTP